MADQTPNQVENSQSVVDSNTSQQTSNFLLTPAQVPAGFFQERMMTASTSYANGDLFYGDGTKFQKLPVGTAGQVLSVAAGVPAWAASSSNGWYPAAGTWTYSSADGQTGVITVPSDATQTYSVGMRVKITQTTVKYAIITAVSTTSLTCFFDTDAVLANAAITSPQYSMMKVPFGFPADPEKWKAELTDTSDRSQSSPGNGTVYNMGSLSLALPIGEWAINVQVSLLTGVSTNNTDYIVQWGLSTANNSYSDSDMYYLVEHQASSGGIDGYTQRVSVNVNKMLTMSAKTTYYLVASIGYSSGSGSSLHFQGNAMTTKITARLAYL